MVWVASTKCEGPWWFTHAGAPEHAVAILCEAISQRKVLSVPIDNPIRPIEFSCARVSAELAKQAQLL